MKSLSEDWASRAELPSHVVTMLNNFPAHLHPMAQFAAAIAALNSESKFAKVKDVFELLISHFPAKEMYRKKCYVPFFLFFF